MAPIFRFMSWLERRRTMCPMCSNQKADGFGGYCSDGCARFDGDVQAHG